ncbi:hypothetical protein BRADO2880 [Bradyrhizobium sp. ORS 278]|nr:hypothetical protein BRADO2880 [Bradyrhizobium sp. ORS 278]
MQRIVRYDTAARGPAPQNPEGYGRGSSAGADAAWPPLAAELIRRASPFATLRDQYLRRRPEDHLRQAQAGSLYQQKPPVLPC